MTASTHPADTSNDGARIDTKRAAMQQAHDALSVACEFAKLYDTEHAAWVNEKCHEAIAALRAALAEQAQPVAWVAKNWSVFNKGGEVASGLSLDEAMDYLTDKRAARGWSAVCVVNKYNMAEPIPPAPVVPPGWRMVPVDSTQEMTEAGATSINYNGGNARWSDIREAWADMLAAAPEAPTPPAPQPLAEQAQPVATADASLGAAIEAIDAALAEQAQPTSEAGWLHRLDMEKSEAWMAGYAQGQKRAAEQAQPVAYRHLHEDGWEYYDAPTADDCAECQPLYTTPPAPVAPPGWRMVPVEPTEDMRDAGDIERDMQDARHEDGCGPIYRAMLAAAPEAPTPPAPQPLTDEDIEALHKDATGYGLSPLGDERKFARAVEGEVLKRMGVQR